jgi:hypothetical protein
VSGHYGSLLYFKLVIFCKLDCLYTVVQRGFTRSKVEARVPPSERQTAIMKLPERHLYLVTQLSVGLRQLVRRDLGDKLRVDRHDEVTYRTVIDLIQLEQWGKNLSPARDPDVRT